MAKSSGWTFRDRGLACHPVQLGVGPFHGTISALADVRPMRWRNVYAGPQDPATKTMMETLQFLQDATLVRLLALDVSSRVSTRGIKAIQLSLEDPWMNVLRGHQVGALRIPATGICGNNCTSPTPFAACSAGAWRRCLRRGLSTGGGRHGLADQAAYVDGETAFMVKTTGPLIWMAFRQYQMLHAVQQCPNRLPDTH